MNLRRLFILACTGLAIVSGVQARIANPYPVAALRLGDVWVLNEPGAWLRLTQLGDVQSLCWLDSDSICFVRELDSGLTDSDDWAGLGILRDLFLVSRRGGPVTQFTIHDFTNEPSPSSIGKRALFTRRLPIDSLDTEIWETIRPLVRDRSLGIRGTQPDASPDQKWIAATVRGEHTGIVLCRYPLGDRYRRFEGDFRRPRFSPGGFVLTYISDQPGNEGIWGAELPDAEAKLILRMPEGFERIVDFGWTSDGSGFILLLAHDGGRQDVYFWEMERRQLTQLSETGDMIQASSWH